MRIVIHSLLIFLSLSTIALTIPQSAVAAWRKKCCVKCFKETCCCPPVSVAPAICPPAVQVQQTVTATTLKPVMETHYLQRPVMTTRNVLETQYRTEQYTETVPVQTTECITVDEGCYKMVWVPKMVTKQIPKTCYQQRTACRTVPYQVTRQVQECTTRTVPVQTVRYVQAAEQVACPVNLGYQSTPYYQASPPVAAPYIAPTCAAPPGQETFAPAAPAAQAAPQSMAPTPAAPQSSLYNGPAATLSMNIEPVQPPRYAPISVAPRMAEASLTRATNVPTAATVWRSPRR